MKNIKLEVFPRHRNGNTNDLTFRALYLPNNVPPASHIHLEYMDPKTGLIYSSEIYDKYRSGLRTYNDTLNSSDVTLASVKSIREPFIERFHLTESLQLECEFQVLDGNLHVFKIKGK